MSLWSFYLGNRFTSFQSAQQIVSYSGPLGSSTLLWPGEVHSFHHKWHHLFEGQRATWINMATWINIMNHSISWFDDSTRIKCKAGGFTQQRNTQRFCEAPLTNNFSRICLVFVISFPWLPEKYYSSTVVDVVGHSSFVIQLLVVPIWYHCF